MNNFIDALECYDIISCQNIAPFAFFKCNPLQGQQESRGPIALSHVVAVKSNGMILTKTCSRVHCRIKGWEAGPRLRFVFSMHSVIGKPLLFRTAQQTLMYRHMQMVRRYYNVNDFPSLWHVALVVSGETTLRCLVINGENYVLHD